MIQHGEMEWVKEHLTEQTFDLNCIEDVLLLTALANHGEAQWVTEQRCFKADFFYENMPAYPQFIELLLILVQQGESEWVKNLSFISSFQPQGPLGQRLLFELQIPLTDHLYPQYEFFQEHPKALEFSESDIRVAEGLMNTSHMRISQSLTQKCRSIFSTIQIFYTNDESKKERAAALQSTIENVIENAPLEVQLFLYRFFINLTTISSMPFLDDHFLRALDVLQGTKKDFVIQLPKTGSRLFLYGKREEDTEISIGFVNDISTESAQVWQRAQDLGIPVAPISSTKPPRERDGVTRVYSRYSGYSLQFLGQFLPSSLQKECEAQKKVF